MKLLKRPLFRTAAAKPKPQVRKLNASVSRAASRAELEDYADDDEEDTREPNMRLTHAFIVVLILHVIAVGGVFGFNAMKSRQAADSKTAAVPATPAENPAPTAPVEATPAPVTAKTVAPAPAVAPVTTAAAPKDTRDIIPAPTASTLAKTTALPVAAPGTHQVAPGDTLSRIATRYHTSIEALEKLNELPAGTVLRVGQVLELPVAPAKTTAAAAPVAAKTAPVVAAPVTAKTTAPEAAKPAPTAAAETTVKDSGEVYTLAKGDNPYSIAKKFKVSFNELMKINDITDPTKLQIGQKLKIPAKK